MDNWKKIAKEVKKKRKKYFKGIKHQKKSKEFEKKYGFRYEDTWELDYSFYLWIVPRLIYLKENRCGSPVILEPKDGDYTNFPSDENDKAWDIILDKMIDGFYYGGIVDGVGILKKDDHEKELEEAFELLAKYHSCLWD